MLKFHVHCCHIDRHAVLEACPAIPRLFPFSRTFSSVRCLICYYLYKAFLRLKHWQLQRVEMRRAARSVAVNEAARVALAARLQQSAVEAGE